MNPDVALFHFLNDFAGQSPALDWLVRALVNDYAVITLMALSLGALWFAGGDRDRPRNQRAVLMALLGIAIVNVLIKLMQLYYFRPRPFATETVKLLFYRPSVSSFPSEPVATMFCFVAGVWAFNRPVARVLLIVASAFALSRVVAGVHYPADVVGGALLGVACTWLPVHHGRVLEPALRVVLLLSQRFNLA